MKVRPVLSRVSAQREYAHTRQDVLPCANLAAELEERLLELFHLCVASSFLSSAKGKEKLGKCPIVKTM